MESSLSGHDHLGSESDFSRHPRDLLPELDYSGVRDLESSADLGWTKTVNQPRQDEPLLELKPISQERKDFMGGHFGNNIAVGTQWFDGVLNYPAGIERTGLTTTLSGRVDASTGGNKVLKMKPAALHIPRQALSRPT